MYRMTTCSFNDHLELEIGKYAERTYFTTLMNSQPQFSASNLFAEVEAEIGFWERHLTTDGKPFNEGLRSCQYIFDALSHEQDAFEDVEKALAFHGRGAWEEASGWYCHAISNLDFALSDWQFAIPIIAVGMHFDPFYRTKERGAKENIEGPQDASSEEMWQIAPLLFRIYRSLDRVFVIGQEITQRQITCLTASMQKAGPTTASSAERPEGKSSSYLGKPFAEQQHEGKQ